MSDAILEQILVQGKNGPEAVLIKGNQVKATNGETFESHSANTKRHIATTPAEAGKVLKSKADGTNSWEDLPAFGNLVTRNKADVFTDAALTGVPTAPTATSGANSTQIATTAYVDSVKATLESTIASGVNLRGTVGTGGDVTILPATAYAKGDMYVVKTSGTYAGQVCEAGDSLLCVKAYGTEGASDSDWTVLQNNINGAVTGPASAVSDNIALFDGSTGKLIKDSSIISTSVTDTISKTHVHANKTELDAIIATGVDINDAVAKKHAHANATQLGKIGKAADGSMTYNGKSVTGVRTVASLEEASAAGAPQGTIFFVVEQRA